jgi:hypothetical protein
VLDTSPKDTLHRIPNNKDGKGPSQYHHYIYDHKGDRLMKTSITGRFKAIIEEKPVFWENERLSMLLTAGISLLIVSWMFWGAVLGKSLLETCSS